ncbi:Sir2 silent information regulator family NAD-dependent deacetylase [Prevotella sp. HMSC073D09]|uniref:Sir2 silent information regulator family NAD-dependent deacetylase n=1 Tax=Prevotella sp. HMSC073D09 TaxID=1739459 RepID=UPI0008A61F51|nr:Sir2 silent information regulator family NAD-dependent deacetylase [Prevotella sp. HMSC073D09]OFQ17313.1 Sir2 silent information regulator family NAD-dependent deacetylase [Prevotella sp. HMSC073D09]
MTFTNSLSERIAHVGRLIADADYILIGAGAGLSAAAGLDYAGKEFEREFQPWIDQYGITDLYSSSFYPFKTEEERWAYWAKHIWFSRFRTGGTELYHNILQLIKGKEYFVITTNVDAQFEKSEFAKEKIFATQGDYAYLQARNGSTKTLVYNESWVKQALAATIDCKVPTELIPHHPLTGELMSPNLRCDDTFVEDERWHRQNEAYHEFVGKAWEHKLLLLEFGVGFNTPSIIRFPFEQMAASNSNISLVRFNRDYPQLMQENVFNFTCFTEELGVVVKRLFNLRSM